MAIVNLCKLLKASLNGSREGKKESTTNVYKWRPFNPVKNIHFVFFKDFVLFIPI
jgi:hypothetical protein